VWSRRLDHRHNPSFHRSRQTVQRMYHYREVIQDV
jgi:hypothetical protein